MPGVAEEIVVSESGYSFPVEDLLTGRGAIFGKSGSGKSNTMTVIAEELLDLSLPFLVVDQDGEYHGLKEEYDVLHAGPGPDCDRTIGVEDGEALADEALEDNQPVVLDVSGFMDEDAARELVHAVVRRLFARENEVQKPFLLIVEEVHEYVPQQGGHDELGQMLVRIAKRGRKRGLGICGVSQRPASVDKDFITQCDWIVWHRLTWRNDTKVVGRILGSEYADRVQDLSDGEAYAMTDWSEDVERVQFRLKHTRDVGATPGLDEFADDHWDAHAYSDNDAAGDGAAGSAPSSGAGTGSASAGTDQSERFDPLDAGGVDDQGVDPPGDGSVQARDDTILDDSHEVSDRPEAPDGGSVGDEVYRGNPIWELGQMLAFVVGAVVQLILNGIRRLIPNVRPQRSRRTPVGFPREESIDWKLTSLLMLFLNLLLLAVVAFAYVSGWI